MASLQEKSSLSSIAWWAGIFVNGQYLRVSRIKIMWIAIFCTSHILSSLHVRARTCDYGLGMRLDCDVLGDLGVLS